MTATDLVAWCKLIGFADQPDLARCEIATFRYRVLHVAARITRGARQTRLRIDRTWRWADRDRHRLAPHPRRVPLTPGSTRPDDPKTQPRQVEPAQPDTTVGHPRYPDTQKHCLATTSTHTSTNQDHACRIEVKALPRSDRWSRSRGQKS